MLNSLNIGKLIGLLYAIPEMNEAATFSLSPKIVHLHSFRVYNMKKSI
jgi:hypothetical protein